MCREDDARAARAGVLVILPVEVRAGGRLRRVGTCGIGLTWSTLPVLVSRSAPRCCDSILVFNIDNTYNESHAPISPRARRRLARQAQVLEEGDEALALGEGGHDSPPGPRGQASTSSRETLRSNVAQSIRGSRLESLHAALGVRPAVVRVRLARRGDDGRPRAAGRLDASREGKAASGRRTRAHVRP